MPSDDADAPAAKHHLILTDAEVRLILSALWGRAERLTEDTAERNRCEQLTSLIQRGCGVGGPRNEGRVAERCGVSVGSPEGGERERGTGEQGASDPGASEREAADGVAVSGDGESED